MGICMYVCVHMCVCMCMQNAATKRSGALQGEVARLRTELATVKVKREIRGECGEKRVGVYCSCGSVGVCGSVWECVGVCGNSLLV